MRFQSLEGLGFFTKDSVSEVALFSHKAGRRFISNSGFYCSFHHDEAGISNVFVLFGHCEMMKQVSTTIYEFTHIIQQPCRRCDIEFI